MNRTVEDLIEIAYAGGGLILDANSYSTDDLINIAYASKNKNATLIIKNISQKSTSDLVNIGYAGEGSVLFED